MADSGASFLALPIELIAQILDLAVSDGLQSATQIEELMFDGPTARHALDLLPFRLASVCRGWRQRILRVPVVWRRVYISFAPTSQTGESQLQYLALVLYRSAQAPLHIYVDKAPGTVADQHLAALRVLQVMLPRAQRLAIRTDKKLMTPRSCIFAHLQQDTPQLRYLSIHDCPKNPDNGIRTLPRMLFTGAPDLIEVTLVDVPLTWFDCSLWADLVTVTLVRCVFEHDDLLAFGTWWPNLQSLGIEQGERNDAYFVLNDEDGTFNGRRMAPLPHLRMLVLRTPFWSPQTIFYRAHLRFDSLRTLVMRYDGMCLWGEYPQSRLRQDMRIFFQHAAPSLEHIIVERSQVSEEFVADIIAVSPGLRRLHFEASTMAPGFFKALTERHDPLSIQDLVFERCYFPHGAADTFARFIEHACLPSTGASSSTSATAPSMALKRLRIAQFPQATKKLLPQRVLDRVRAVVPCAEIEDITDFKDEKLPLFVGQYTGPAPAPFGGTWTVTNVVHKVE